MNNINMNEITINGKVYMEKSTIPVTQFIQPEGEFFILGNNYYIRTVTFHYTGTIVGINDKEILLSNAAWIADSGRWTQAIGQGFLDEVEPYPDDVIIIVNRQALCDASPWKHKLPRVQQ
jgi:hypothetical protein